MPIRTKPLKEDEGKRSILHAILFDKKRFTLDNAKKWLENRNYKYIHNRETKNEWRFRIKEQIKDYKFFTTTLDNDTIKMIFMYK